MSGADLGNEVNRTGADAGPLELLVSGLAELISRVPENSSEMQARRDGISAAMRQLDSLGLDAESLVRFGFARTLAGQVVSGLLLGALLRKDAESIADWFHAEQWATLLQVPQDDFGSWLTEEPKPERAQAIQSHLVRVLPAIMQWIHFAKIADVLELVTPTVAELEAAKALPPTPAAVIDEYVWVVERSIESEPSGWSTTSLHLEFSLMTGAELPGVSGSLPWHTRVDANALNLEIAGRAVEAARDRSPKDDDDLLYRIQMHAQVLLRQDRHREASALFDFYAKSYPSNAAARNNAAFCKIPVNPSEAHHDLLKAERQGFTPLGVLVHNLACCLSILNREGEALDRLEYYWQREREDEPVPATLWRLGSAGWEIYGERDTRLAVCEVAEQLANSLGLPERSSTWRRRKGEI